MKKYYDLTEEDSIYKQFFKFNWFVRVEHTSYTNEFNLYVKEYPFSEEKKIFQYEKKHQVRIRIYKIGS